MRFGLLVVVASCAEQTGSPNPTVEILQPLDGATVCGAPLPIELSIADFELVPMGGEASEGAGHVDFTANGQAAAMTQQLSFEIQLEEDGTYELEAELVHADHSSLEPAVADQVRVTVDTSICGGES